ILIGIFMFYPDFFTNQAQVWWSRWINDFRRVNLSFDGLWIDMNEPGMNMLAMIRGIISATRD
ncbi:unnamed protein product, partial [Rotaria sp. Silwood2]